MKKTILTALTGCFVYGGLLLMPLVAQADTLTDLTEQLHTALELLQSLQTTGGSTTDKVLNIPQTDSTPEPTYATYTVRMTAYNALPDQTDSTPDYTSIGAHTNPEIIAARSEDLSEELPYGTVIYVKEATTNNDCGYKYVSDKIGLRVIGDAMNARMRDKIDILLDYAPIPAQNGLLRNPAKALGMCQGVQIAVVGKLDITTDGKIDPMKVKMLPQTQEELAAAIGITGPDALGDLALAR